MKLVYEVNGKEEESHCEPEEVGVNARVLAEQYGTDVTVYSGGSGKATLRYFVSANNGDVYCELINEDASYGR